MTDAMKGKWERVAAEKYEEFLKVHVLLLFILV